MARSKGDARELAHEIAFLVRHRRATVDCYSIFAVFRLNGAKALRDSVKHLIPTGALQRAIFPSAAHQWIGQAVRMIHCLICCSAFGAEHSMVQGKIFARLDTYYFPIGHFEIHTTLHATVTAMGWNIAIYRFVGLPARQWLLSPVKIKRFWLVLS